MKKEEYRAVIKYMQRYTALIENECYFVYGDSGASLIYGTFWEVEFKYWLSLPNVISAISTHHYTKTE